MKKILIIGLGLLGLVLDSFGQTASVDTVKAIREGEKSNSGAKQDVLVNYLQIAAKNITSTTSAVQLKVSWFALNDQDSVDKYKNKDFIHSRWQRNGQFLAGIGVDKSNNFNSFQAGFSYNLLNERDSTLHYYRSAYEPYYDRESTILQETETQYVGIIISALKSKLFDIDMSVYANSINSTKPVDTLKQAIQHQISGFPSVVITDSLIRKLQNDINNLVKKGTTEVNAKSIIEPEADSIALYAGNAIFNAAINTYVKALGKQPLSFGNFVDPVQTDKISKGIDQLVIADPVLRSLNPKGLASLNDSVLIRYKQLVHLTAQKPLLTFGYDYNYGKGTVLTTHEAGFTYIQGISKQTSDKITELTGSVTDTLGSNDPTGKVRNFDRNIITFTGGFNRVLAVQKKVSVMEINISGEDDLATEGFVSKKNTNVLYLDAYFRARLPATPWLKFDLKYAPHSGNVLGFLDFTYNLDKP